MQVQNIVQKEFSKCIEHLCQIQGSSFSVEENKEDPTKLNVYIYGEENTIHRQGIYKAEFTFTDKFPQVRPEGKFISPLPHHCNIDENGSICLDYYNKWNLDTYQNKSFVILVENLCTFIHNQNPNSCLRKNIGEEQNKNPLIYMLKVRNQASVCRQAFLDG
ncbi:hypothetical protein ABPG72_004568 [Tetrahymena utriculariae]